MSFVGAFRGGLDGESAGHLWAASGLRLIVSEGIVWSDFSGSVKVGRL